MTLTIELNGKVVARSRNLRGLLDYARKHFIHRVAVYKQNGHGRLYVEFENGAQCRHMFEDYSVLVGWVLSRRSWFRNHGLEQGDHWPQARRWHVPAHIRR